MAWPWLGSANRRRSMVVTRARSSSVQHVLHPMQSLNHPHGGTTGPIEAAGRGQLKVDLLIAELDRLQASIDEDLDARRHGGGEAQVVGGGHSVHHDAGLVAACDGADDGTIIRYGCAAGQAASTRPVVEAAVDATKLPGGDEALQGLIHRSATAEVGKVARRPNVVRVGGDPVEQPGAEVEIERGNTPCPKYATFFGRREGQSEIRYIFRTTLTMMPPNMGTSPPRLRAAYSASRGCP